MSEMQKVTIYSDGSSRGNPGPGGYGTIIVFIADNGKRYEKEITAGYLHTTNNRMELMGAIAGLEALNKPCRVTMVTDSQYVVNAFNQHWIDGWLKKNWRSSTGMVKNIDLWKRLLAAIKGHQVTWKWVKGHAGHPENERCDEMAVKSALSDDVIVDEGMSE